MTRPSRTGHPFALAWLLATVFVAFTTSDVLAQ
ncbi:MAG: hypothetical protein ACI9W4_002956, partial [Rhodothermales bacterium]